MPMQTSNVYAGPNGQPLADAENGASPLDIAPMPAARTAHPLELADLRGSDSQGKHLLPDRLSALRQVDVRLQVSVGEVAISIGELLAAREHQVFVLDREVDAPVDIVLDGRVVARGQLVAVDDHFAVRITQLPTTSAT